ncbi:MAG: HK97-gp10 family putative phage morphogenesis protein [Pseudomonadota bacterium]
MDFEVKIEGARELEQKLKALDGVAQFKAVRRAAMYAMLPVLKKAKALAPVGEYEGDREGGTLRDSLVRKAVRPQGLEREMSVIVGPRKSKRGDPFYAKFVERGTRNTPAQPFLRPALESQGDVVVERLMKQLRRTLDKLVPPNG